MNLKQVNDMKRRPPPRRLSKKQLDEIVTAERYYNDAEKEMVGRSLNNLIGQALIDMRDRAKRILDMQRAGLSFAEVEKIMFAEEKRGKK
jgi:hypothetical protein